RMRGPSMMNVRAGMDCTSGTRTREEGSRGRRKAGVSFPHISIYFNPRTRDVIRSAAVDAVSQATALVEEATRICVLTGAGISTDSGIPDFRGLNGIWTKNPEAEKAATIQTYVRDPAARQRAWQRYADGGVWSHREPNDGHHALVRLEQRGKLDTLITQ